MSESCAAKGCSSNCTVNLFDRLRSMDLELAKVVRQPASSSQNSEQAIVGDYDDLVLQLNQPLPLVAELAWREIDQDYVWIAVQEAALVALDSASHSVMLAFQTGASPHELLNDGAEWPLLSGLIGRLASAGFIRGIIGYRDNKPPKAERFARLHLTRACQLECTHCYADSSPRVDRSNEITTERWSQFLNEFADIGGEQVLFTGGEALMHDGCPQLMREAKDLGLHVTLFSNGMLVPKFVDDIKRYADLVQISLDGPTPDLNDVIRGRNTFQHILKALDVLAEAGVNTRIGMTAVPKDWNIWVREFEKIRNRYINYPNITYKLSYGIMAYGRGGALDATEVADRTSVKTFLNEVNGFPGPSITRYQSGCGYAEQIVVGPDGIIYPCHLLDSPVCHIDERPIAEIAKILWGVGEAFGVDHVEGCKSCEIRYLCGGSCRVLAGRASGSRKMNLCSPEAKLQKYKNMAQTYHNQYG